VPASISSAIKVESTNQPPIVRALARVHGRVRDHDQLGAKRKGGTNRRCPRARIGVGFEISVVEERVAIVRS
jgi:hypothetical protein